jgi:hypothetical protein
LCLSKASFKPTYIQPASEPIIQGVVATLLIADVVGGRARRQIRLQAFAQAVDGVVQISQGGFARDIWPKQANDLFAVHIVMIVEDKEGKKTAHFRATP